MLNSRTYSMFNLAPKLHQCDSLHVDVTCHAVCLRTRPQMRLCCARAGSRQIKFGRLRHIVFVLLAVTLRSFMVVASHDDDSSGTADKTVSVSSDGANTGADALLDATSDLDYTNVVRSEAEVAADASLVEHVPSSILQLTLDDASGSGASLVQTDAPSLDVVLSQEHLALELYSRAEEARWGAPSAGIVRNASLALQLLREAAALRAGRGSASALCALARMHETGWNGNPDLDVYLPLALGVGGLNRQSSGSRVLRRVTRMLKPFIVEGRAALDVVAGVARKAMAASAADGGALTTSTDTPPPRHSRQLQHNTTLVQPDMATAVALYKEAAELGNATAAFTMAVLHSYGLFGVPADERKAVSQHPWTV